jgi:hypothetical protein
MLGYFGPFPKLAKKFLKVNTIFVLTEFIRHSKYFLISSYEDVDCWVLDCLYVVLETPRVVGWSHWNCEGVGLS